MRAWISAGATCFSGNTGRPCTRRKAASNSAGDFARVTIEIPAGLCAM